MYNKSVSEENMSFLIFNSFVFVLSLFSSLAKLRLGLTSSVVINSFYCINILKSDVVYQQL